MSYVIENKGVFGQVVSSKSIFTTIYYLICKCFLSKSRSCFVCFQWVTVWWEIFAVAPWRVKLRRVFSTLEAYTKPREKSSGLKKIILIKKG